MAQAKAVVFLADGFEEVEALTPIDYLRRAGVEVTIAGVGTTTPTGAHGVTVNADCGSGEISTDIDAVILPGGMPGAANLAASADVEAACKKHFAAGRLVAAICAAPAVALGSFGILDGREFTCYPSFEEKVPKGQFIAERVVVDGNVITSRGPATAVDFALALVRYLVGEDSAKSIEEAILLNI